MGILPMVQVLLHFGGTPKQQSREREELECLSLTRLLVQPSAEVRAYTHHGLEAHATVDADDHPDAEISLKAARVFA